MPAARSGFDPLLCVHCILQRKIPRRLWSAGACSKLHELKAAVFRASLWRVIGRHWLGLAKALGGEPVGADPQFHECAFTDVPILPKMASEVSLDISLARKVIVQAAESTGHGISHDVFQGRELFHKFGSCVGCPPIPYPIRPSWFQVYLARCEARLTFWLFH
jgi:hypothetical protein